MDSLGAKIMVTLGPDDRGYFIWFPVLFLSIRMSTCDCLQEQLFLAIIFPLDVVPGLWLLVQTSWFPKDVVT